MPPRWLTAEERQAWVGLLSSVGGLDAALDRQLRHSVGLSHASYGILAVLSDAPESGLHMSELSVLTNNSQSRLSHAISRLETAGMVLRSPCPRSGRAVHARLTTAGRDAVHAAAPEHVATVRQLLFDHLNPEQVTQLTTITTTILTALARAGFPAPDFVNDPDR